MGPRPVMKKGVVGGHPCGPWWFGFRPRDFQSEATSEFGFLARDLADVDAVKLLVAEVFETASCGAVGSC